MKHWRYAHRGLFDPARGIPENSMAAFRRAVERGFPSELDVHLLADGSLAVFHDSELRRMTGRDGVIEELDAARRGACRLGGTEEAVPAFADVLALYEGTGLPLLVELKAYRGNHDALAARAVEELDRYRVPYLIESFDPRCLLWLRRNRPEIVRGQLAQDFLRGAAFASGQGRRTDVLLTLMALNPLTKPDFVAFRFEHRDAPALRLARLGGAAAFYWTVRSRADLERAEAEGAQPIFEGFIP